MKRLALLGWLAAVSCGTDVERVPDVVLVTLDTIVPGRLGCYGGDAPTPNLDALARRGVVFTEARSVAPITLPAHASMLTGLVPARHGVRVNGATRLSEDAETLAERLRAEGYATAAFVGAEVLDSTYGLDQGFDAYSGPGSASDTSFVMGELPAATVVDRALEWWNTRDADRPAFLWVHLFDPHMPHVAPEEHVARAGGDTYGGEIAYADAELGRLLARVDDDALILFVGDHGEAFGAHGEATHGAFAYDSTLRVPFVVRLPGAARAGERSAANVSVTDVFATVEHTLGLAQRTGLDGLAVTDAVPDDRGVYFESYYGYSAFGWSPMAGWLAGGWKLIQAPRPELFHVTVDPLEANDLSRAEPATVAALRESLRALIDAPALPVTPIRAGAAHESTLAQLGYAGGGVDAETPAYPSPFEREELPSPHTRASFLGAFSDAQALYERGDAQLAISKLREILTDNSRNHSAQQLTGLCLMRFQQWQAAAQAFQSAMRYREGPWAGGWLNLAICFDNLGQQERALDAYLRSHSIAPLPEGVRPRVRALLEHRGREGDAERLLGTE
ncbi:MAG: sulfatase [Planctomycetota bacterium]